MAAPAPLPKPSTLHRRAWMALALAGAATGVAGAVGAWSARQGATPKNNALLPGDDVCLVAPPTPYDPASGRPPTVARTVPAEARCPVCGMFPARAPEWAAQVIFAQGEAHFFDSPLSLFMYLHDVARYSPGRSAQDIAAAYVHDSARRDDAAWIDARSAFYVHGSNAKGPMRAGNLPAFATQEAAQAFAQRRGGQVLAFRQVDAALIATLAGQGGHPHGH